MNKLLTVLFTLLLVGCNYDYSNDRQLYDYTIINEVSTSTGTFDDFTKVLSHNKENFKFEIIGLTGDSIYGYSYNEIFYKYILEYSSNIDINFICNGEIIQSSGYSSNAENRSARFISKPLLDKNCNSDTIAVEIYEDGVKVFYDDFDYFITKEESVYDWEEVRYSNPISVEGFIFLSVIIIAFIVWLYKRLYYKNLERYINDKKVIKLMDIKSFIIMIIMIWFILVVGSSILNQNDLNTDYHSVIDYNRFIDREYKDREFYTLDLSFNEISSGIYGTFFTKDKDYTIDIYFDNEFRPVDHRDIIYKVTNKPMTNIEYTDIDEYEYIYIIIYNENEVIEYFDKVSLDKYK